MYLPHNTVHIQITIDADVYINIRIYYLQYEWFLLFYIRTIHFPRSPCVEDCFSNGIETNKFYIIELNAFGR